MQPYEEISESDQSTADIHSSRWKCKVLKWGLFRLPAYVANVTKVFTKFSGCNTRLLVGFYCLYVGEA